jgi:uncharacterized protein YndB with AHSA1/START domain
MLAAAMILAPEAGLTREPPADPARGREECVMSDAECRPVSVSRRIEAPADEVFAVLADPGRHPGIDGSGMLREADGNSPITGVGDTFTVRMRNAEMGDYVMANHVVEFEPGRRIGWEPVLAAASRPEDQSSVGDPGQYRWSYTLVPDGDGATIVTETYDCARAPQWLRRAVRNGERWADSMAATLDKLAQQCAQR